MLSECEWAVSSAATSKTTHTHRHKHHTQTYTAADTDPLTRHYVCQIQWLKWGGGLLPSEPPAKV